MRKIQAVGDSVLSMYKALNLILNFLKRGRGEGKKREICFPRRVGVLSYHRFMMKSLPPSSHRWAGPPLSLAPLLCITRFIKPICLPSPLLLSLLPSPTCPVSSVLSHLLLLLLALKELYFCQMLKEKNS